jgi:hypothetical protein
VPRAQIREVFAQVACLRAFLSTVDHDRVRTAA